MIEGTNNEEIESQKINSFKHKLYTINLKLKQNKILLIFTKDNFNNIIYKKNVTFENLNFGHTNYFYPFNNDINKLYHYLVRVFHSNSYYIKENNNDEGQTFITLVLHYLIKNKDKEFEIKILDKDSYKREEDEKIQLINNKSNESNKNYISEIQVNSIRKKNDIYYSEEKNMILEKDSNDEENDCDNDKNNYSLDNNEINNASEDDGSEIKININCGPAPLIFPSEISTKDNTFSYQIKNKNFNINIYKRNYKEGKYQEIIFEIIDSKDNTYCAYINFGDFLNLNKRYYELFDYSIDDIFDDFLIIFNNNNFGLKILTNKIELSYSINNISSNSKSNLFYNLYIFLILKTKERTEEELNIKIEHYYNQIYTYIKEKENEKKKNCQLNKTSKSLIKSKKLNNDNISNGEKIRIKKSQKHEIEEYSIKNDNVNGNESKQAEVFKFLKKHKKLSQLKNKINNKNIKNNSLPKYCCYILKTNIKGKNKKQIKNFFEKKAKEEDNNICESEDKKKENNKLPNNDIIKVKSVEEIIRHNIILNKESKNEVEQKTNNDILNKDIKEELKEKKEEIKEIKVEIELTKDEIKEEVKETKEKFKEIKEKFTETKDENNKYDLSLNEEIDKDSINNNNEINDLKKNLCNNPNKKDKKEIIPIKNENIIIRRKNYLHHKRKDDIKCFTLEKYFKPINKK